jgi:hypothetical protein
MLVVQPLYVEQPRSLKLDFNRRGPVRPNACVRANFVVCKTAKA